MQFPENTMIIVFFFCENWMQSDLNKRSVRLFTSEWCSMRFEGLNDTDRRLQCMCARRDGHDVVRWEWTRKFGHRSIDFNCIMQLCVCIWRSLGHGNAMHDTNRMIRIYLWLCVAAVIFLYAKENCYHGSHFSSMKQTTMRRNMRIWKLEMRPRAICAIFEYIWIVGHLIWRNKPI